MCELCDKDECREAMLADTENQSAVVMFLPPTLMRNRPIGPKKLTFLPIPLVLQQQLEWKVVALICSYVCVISKYS